MRVFKPWMAPAGLVLLALIPAATGSMSLINTSSELLAGTDGSGRDVARYVEHPVLIFTHVIAGVAFALLGVLQVTPRFRARHMMLHRRLGRGLGVAALAAGVTAVWMNAIFPPPGGVAQQWVTGIFGAAMTLSVAFGLSAVYRGEIARHRAWMMRGYALGLGAGTQRLMIVPLLAMNGWALTPGIILTATAGGWIANLVVAELLIRRPVLRARWVAA